MTTRLLTTAGSSSSSNNNNNNTSVDSPLCRPTFSSPLTPSTAAASSPSTQTKTAPGSHLAKARRESRNKRGPPTDRNDNASGDEEDINDQNDNNNDRHASDSDHGGPAIDSWDDAFDLGPVRSLRHLLGQLHRQCASSTSSLSSTSEPESSSSTSSSSSPHALPVPTITAAQTTTTTTTESTLSSTKEASPMPSALLPQRVRSTGRKALMNMNPHQSTVPATSSTFSHIDPLVIHDRLDKATPTLNHSLPPIPPTLTATVGLASLARPTLEDCIRPPGATNPQLPQLQLRSLPDASPYSSAASSPRAITASITAPSTATVTSTGSPIHKDGDKNDEDNPTLSQKTMTTITQEMMLSNLPAYSGIITRMNPFTRVAAWVDDLDDLQVPEEDLRFSHVRSALAKSSSVPDTLGSIENWDTESEGSGYASESHSKEADRLQKAAPFTAPFGSLEGLENIKCRADMATGRVGTLPGSYTIETLDDDFEFAEDFGSLKLNVHQHQRASSGAGGLGLSRKQSSLLQWQDSGSDVDDVDFGTPLDYHSQTSSTSSSRGSNTEDDNLLEGVIFPEEMESLKLVTTRPYRPDTEPSIFGKESHFQVELDDFWDGLDVEDSSVFRRQGRNKNLVERVQIIGRERSGSRVHGQVVTLKDFVAQPSRIPRLCRTPGDTSRPITPAQSLSRKHSTHIDIPLRNVSSKSSLPRPNRTSIPRRESVKAAITTSVSDDAVSSRNASALPSPLVSRSSTPTVLQLSPSRRNSLLGNKDEFPTFKSSSLAMRTVSFTEPAEISSAHNAPQAQPDGPKLSSPPRGVKSFASLRTLVKKLDLGRPRLPSRGLIPVFETLNTRAEPESSTELCLAPDATETGESKPLPARPTSSRNSSFTDWGSLVGSTENGKDSRPSSRVGIPLGNISEISTADLEDTHSTTPSVDRLPRLFFLKRSPKNSMFSDGSELERFDNLPVFSDAKAQAAVQDNRRQSVDRVAAWLRKPQSIPNFREAIARVEQSPPPESSMIRKSKSIRKSLFDIFGQNSDQSKEKKKKQKPAVGPKLIRNLSELKARQVDGMVYNPSGKMWDGNDDALDHFEEEDEEVGAVTRKDQLILETSGHPPPHSNFGYAPFPNISRPALITNLSQNSKQRTQVAGKMVFDPARMCWVVNPEYLARRRHKLSSPLCEAWGDELDVFAGLSDDSDRSEVEDNNEADEEGRAVASEQVPLEEELGEHGDKEGEAMAGSSLSKAKGQRWVGRPAFQRYSSHDLLSEEQRLGPWAEINRPPSSLVNDATESRPASMGLHSIVSKSSRKSLNGIHSGSMAPSSGGGYSSRGEFEVGVEFDTTTSFLEQCIATEAQHRMDAGKFFALPYGPSGDTSDEMSKVAVAECSHAEVAASTSLLSRMTLKKRRSSLKHFMKADPVPVNPTAMAQVTPAAEPSSGTSWFSWYGRSKTTRDQTDMSDSGSAPPRNDHSKTEVLTTTGLETEVVRKSKNKSTKRRQPKHSSLGASTILNLSWHRPAPTESWTPAHMTVASRGKKGLFHRGRPTVRKESPWGPPHPKGDSLSYSAATLALTHREKFATYSASSFTHERRRLGDHTFEPLNNLEYIDSIRSRSTSKWNACKNIMLDLDHLEEEEIERGYRIMSTACGRPPQRPRLDLLFELELHSGPRFRST